MLPFAPLCLSLLLAAGGGEAAGLEAALAGLGPEKVAADLRFLASDEMRGRDTPSLELRVAARYLRARLERLGFEPGTPGGWFHEYPLDVQRLGEGSHVELLGEGGTRVLEYGEDCFLHSTAGLGVLDLEAPAVFCGAGERKDYGAADPTGAWAVVLDGDGTDARRERYASRAGAVGLVIVNDPSRRERPRDWILREVAQKADRGVVSYPEGEEAAGAGAPAPEFPVLVVSLAMGEVLLGAPEGELPPLGTRLPWSVHDVRVGGSREAVENVVGLWPGADPELAREAILLSAHYDHVGMRGDEVMNGADDNASGTSGLLAVADALAALGPLRRSVLLVWVSGEEKGLYGSRAFAEAPPLLEGMRVVCDINVDMIGRNAPDELYVTPSPAHADYGGLVQLFERLAPLEGFPQLGGADEFYNRSDQAMFARMGIPVAFLHAGEHADYHQPTDTEEKIDPGKVLRVARLLVRALDGLQGDELPFP